MKRRKKDYIGEYPVNSRITIDYSKKKPEVKFEYPDKRSSQLWLTPPVIYPTIIFTLITILLLLYSTDNLGTEGSYPSVDDCVTYSNHWTNRTNLIGFKHVCLIDGESYTIKTTFIPSKKFRLYTTNPKVVYQSDVTTSDSTETLVDLIIYAGLIIITVIIFVFWMWIFLLFYFKTKWGQKFYPEASKVLADAHFATTFDKVPENKQIVIPLFKNIYLDYKATKGFSKHLTRVEIREHEFDKIIRKGKKSIRKKGQVFLWKATFYFNEIPKDGDLEVWWT